MDIKNTNIMSTINNYQTIFIQENMGQEFDKSIKKFVKQIKKYFKLVWFNHHELDTLDSGYIEDLNQILANYILHEEYAILDDAFYGPDIPFKVLSKESLKLLYYFYGIKIK